MITPRELAAALRGASQSRHPQMRAHVARYCGYLEGMADEPLRLQALAQRSCMGYMEERRRTALAPSTHNCILSAVRAVYRAAVLEGLLEEAMPVISVPYDPRGREEIKRAGAARLLRQRDMVTESDIRRLTRALRAEHDEAPPKARFALHRNMVMVALSWELGLRASDAVALRRGDFITTRQGHVFVQVLGKAEKARGRPAAVPVSPESHAAVMRYMDRYGLRDPDSLVLPNAVNGAQLDPERYSQIVRGLFRRHLRIVDCRAHELIRSSRISFLLGTGKPLDEVCKEMRVSHQVLLDHYDRRYNSKLHDPRFEASVVPSV